MLSWCCLIALSLSFHWGRSIHQSYYYIISDLLSSISYDLSLSDVLLCIHRIKDTLRPSKLLMPNTALKKTHSLQHMCL